MGPFQRYQSTDRDLNQVQSNLANALNPILGNPLLFGFTLTGISLASGSNTINHGLGRTLQGWFLTGINAGVTIYDQQASNTKASTTLILHSSGPATVNIYVY